MKGIRTFRSKELWYFGTFISLSVTYTRRTQGEHKMIEHHMTENVKIKHGLIKIA